MIVIADIHLGKVNDSIQVEGDLSQMVDAISRLDSILARARLTFQSIVVAGDIFDRTNPTTQCIAAFFGWLSRCASHKVQVVLLAGNHDSGVDWASTGMFASANLPNVIVAIQPIILPMEDSTGSRMTLFWPHVPGVTQEHAEKGHGSVSKWVATMFPGAELIVTHGMVADTDYCNDIFFEAGNAVVVEPSAFKSLKLMVLGHVHNHMEAKNGKWAYPGSLTITNFGEIDESKGFIEVCLKDLSHTWSEFPDDVTPWVHLDLDLTEKDDTCLDEAAIAGAVAGAVVKITVRAKAHGVVNESRIRQMVAKYGTVSRFETVISTSSSESVSKGKAMSHDQRLAAFLKAADATPSERSKALQLGKEIIAGVLA